MFGVVDNFMVSWSTFDNTVITGTCSTYYTVFGRWYWLQECLTFLIILWHLVEKSSSVTMTVVARQESVFCRPSNRPFCQEKNSLTSWNQVWFTYEFECAVFGHELGDGKRPGHKVLRKKLIGEKILDWYPTPIQKQDPMFEDPNIRRRLLKNERLKRRGKGPPKKGHSKRANPCR